MTIKIGDIYSSKRCGEYIVVKVNTYSDIVIRFLQTDTVIHTQSTYIYRGNIKDTMYPTIRGIGCIGDGKHKVSVNGKHTREYCLWRTLITNHSKGRYIVCDRWKNYQLFCDDLLKIKGYEEWLVSNSYKLQANNKTVTKNTCVFTLKGANNA